MAENPIPEDQRYAPVYEYAGCWCYGSTRSTAHHRGVGWPRRQVEEMEAKGEGVIAVELIPVGEADRLRAIEAEHRKLEDAALILWAELPIAETKGLAAEVPALAGFLRHLHHRVEHEQAMVRRNVWAGAGVAPSTQEPTPEHKPMVVGGPRIYAWECPCGARSSGEWPTDVEAAYAATVHVRNPGGPR